MPRTLLLLPLALLSGCGSSPSGKANASDVDPAVTAALADPLMADPQLDRRSNDGALRPADEPYRAMVPPGSPDPLRDDAPPTLLARVRPAMGDGFTGCGVDVAYSYGWAARLSPDLTLPAEAQVAEAAGNDTAKCRLRLVAYSAPLTAEAILDSYRRTARTGGYTASERPKGPATVLTASRSRDGARFMVSVKPAGSNTTVDLADNRGR
ncbi:hypothetical protein [Sphingomonas sp. SUN039]|uniref:hypothetical protein n=1 Tax=Sphingomonas sp. SUN039 TaxID=2937787 RepID=UPI002164ADDF|nr:hypothetical protein [Sphingomonas sp. SUN039]UVO55024.1 hypothetical protein M0209_13115 [Sphingomonas sp. SUN039]